MRFESLNRKRTLHERLPRHPLPVPSTRALCMGTAREREEVRTARMHPGSANDVSANADERKNTTVRSALRALNFFFSCSSRDTLKIIYSFFLPNSHTDTKIRRKHAHVKNDASTSMHFYVHPYTRERISHTRDCNVIALNASHNIHLHIVSHILSAYFLGRGFVCMFVCRKTDALTDAQRTTSNEKKT